MAIKQGITVTMQGDTMKPHYLCTKGECLKELQSYEVMAHSDLTVPELRVLLREARKKEGILPPAKTQSIMDEIKKANLEALRTMCSARSIAFNQKTTVGEMRLALRQWVMDAGTAETVFEIGKYAGATFAELSHSVPDYVKWAVEEVQRSPTPDWRLAQLARWAKKMEHNNGPWEEEETFVKKEFQKSLDQKLKTMDPKKTPENKTPPNQEPGMASTSSPAEQNMAQQMMTMMQGMMTQIHTLGAEIKEVKQAQESGSSSKTRKTSTVASMDFEKVTPEEP